MECYNIVTIKEVLSLETNNSYKFYCIYDGDIYKFKYTHKKGGGFKINNLTDTTMQEDYVPISKIDRILREYNTTRFDLKTVWRVLHEVRGCGCLLIRDLLLQDLSSLKFDFTINSKFREYIERVNGDYFGKTEQSIRDLCE